MDLKHFLENTQRCVANPPLHRGSVCLWAPATLRVQTPAVVHATPLYMTRFVYLFKVRIVKCLLLLFCSCDKCLLLFPPPPLRVVQWKSCPFCTLEARTMLPERTCWTWWGSPLSSTSLPTAPIILRTRTSTRASPWRTITKPTSAPGSTRQSSLSVSSLRIFTTVLWSPMAAINSWVCWWRRKHPTQPPCLSLLCSWLKFLKVPSKTDQLAQYRPPLSFTMAVTSSTPPAGVEEECPFIGLWGSSLKLVLQWADWLGLNSSFTQVFVLSEQKATSPHCQPSSQINIPSGSLFPFFVHLGGLLWD